MQCQCFDKITQEIGQQINHDQYKQDNINFLLSLLVSTVISVNSTVLFYFQITDISVKTAN